MKQIEIRVIGKATDSEVAIILSEAKYEVEEGTVDPDFPLDRIVVTVEGVEHVFEVSAEKEKT